MSTTAVDVRFQPVAGHAAPPATTLAVDTVGGYVGVIAFAIEAYAGNGCRATITEGTFADGRTVEVTHRDFLGRSFHHRFDSARGALLRDGEVVARFAFVKAGV